MSWLITGAQKIDPDAAVYLSRVEAADGQVLEAGVRTAVESFIVGCKADGIWTAIKASCILAGARTLAGALVPLVGTAPTNFNFVSGDYNRKTGLVGNGSSKYLNSNRSTTTDPVNNTHIAVYASSGMPSLSCVIGAGTTGAPNRFSQIVNNGGPLSFALNSSEGAGGPAGSGNATGLLGASRSSSSLLALRYSNTSPTASANASIAPTASDIAVFARILNGAPGTYASARLAFYSIGESLNLALLDARVTTLVNALSAAIP